jgi:hypothetical protein
MHQQEHTSKIQAQEGTDKEAVTRQEIKIQR